MKHLKRKRRRGLVTRRIVYRNRQHPHDRPQELTVSVRRDETLDPDHAAAMVAVRTSVPLSNVQIVKVVGVDPGQPTPAGSPHTRHGRGFASRMNEHRLVSRPCTASTTNNLLDCDCGYVTDHTKIHILTLVEGHTVHTMERELDRD